MKIVCELPVNGEQKMILEEAAGGNELVFVPDGKLSFENMADAEIVIGNPPSECLKDCKKLKLLQLNIAGADKFVKKGVLPEGTVLTNATGAYHKAVAEHALAMTMSLMKKLHFYRDSQNRREWTDHGTVTSFSHAVVLVVGMGDIGGEYARLAKALGAYVIGVRRRKTADKPDCADELCGIEQLGALLPRADVIFSVLPGTDATFHIYTAERFKLMKKTAYFINCGRGNAVSGEVLYGALKAGEIAGAAIDVTEQEPLPKESPLWELDELIITPHVAGYYHLADTLDEVTRIAAENLKRFINGEEPINLVDFRTGYKL